MGERADRIEAQVAPDLEPDFGTNAVGDRRLEPCVDQAASECLDARSCAAVQLSERKPATLHHVDDPRRGENGCGVHHAANDPCRIDEPADRAIRIRGTHARSVVFTTVSLEVPPGNAILHRHDGGVGVTKVMKFGRYLTNLMRLDRQQHHILRAGVAHRRACHRAPRPHFAAILELHPHTLFTDGLEICSARDERDVFIGSREQPSQVTADGAGTNHRNFHAMPFMRVRRGLSSSNAMKAATKFMALAARNTVCQPPVVAPMTLAIGTSRAAIPFAV